LRVEQAKRMLEEGTHTFNEITYKVGYEDISFFRKIFVRLTGLRPKEYQQKFSVYAVLQDKY
jgi:YesN/AraC family two-component response regulator